MKKKKLKVRKSVLICFILLVSSICFFIFNNKKEITPEVDYVSSIMAYKESILDKDFLTWIGNNYSKEVLKSLDDSLKNGTYDKSVFHKLTGSSYIVLKDLYSKEYESRNDVTIIEGKKDKITIGYAGDVSLADNWAIMPYYNSRKKGVLGILSEDIVSSMKSLDWMIVNSEFAFSSRGKPIKNKQYTFRANPDNVKIYDEMGVDMVTLANNHVYDYGKDAFLDTLTTLKNANIPYIGAGKNNKEAESAHYLVINGYKIAFLSATRAEKYIMTPEATNDSEGVFRCYDPTRLSERIKEEKEKSDYVVAIVHWGRESTHKLENVQKQTGKLYIDSGADMVIGHHAHVLQGMEFYKGKLIAYNLGNFIFNSLTVDTGILTWSLDNDGNSEFYFLPCLQKNYRTSLVDKESALKLYKKISDWSINVSIDENGKLYESKK